MTTNNTSAQAIEKCKELIQAAKSAPPERRLEALGIESTASYILSILEPTSAQQEGREDEKAIRAILRKHVDIGWMEAIESGLSHAVVCAMQEYATSQLSDKDKLYQEALKQQQLLSEHIIELTEQLQEDNKRIVEMEEGLEGLSISEWMDARDEMLESKTETIRKQLETIKSLQSKLQGERAAAERGWVAGNERGRRYPNESYIGRNMELSTYLNNNYPSQEK
jgi:hypothetical protein